MMGMPSSRSDCRFSSSSMTPVNSTAAGAARAARRSCWSPWRRSTRSVPPSADSPAVPAPRRSLHGQRELLAENVGDEGGHHAGLARAQRPRVRVGGVAGLRHHLQNAFALVLATFSGWRSARDTVIGDTPASLATSSMRGGLAGGSARRRRRVGAQAQDVVVGGAEEGACRSLMLVGVVWVGAGVRRPPGYQLARPGAPPGSGSRRLRCRCAAAGI